MQNCLYGSYIYEYHPMTTPELLNVLKLCIWIKMNRSNYYSERDAPIFTLNKGQAEIYTKND